MKRKALLGLSLAPALAIALLGGVLLVRQVSALDVQPPDPPQVLPWAARGEASQPGAPPLQAEPAPDPQFLAPLAYADCALARFQDGTLPFVESSTTLGGLDDYNLGTSGLCAGGGFQGLYTGLGEDVVFVIATDRTCTLTVGMRPLGAHDLALYVERDDCFDVAGNCVIVDDSGGAGIQEDVQFEATAQGHHYIIVDGYNGASGPFELTISELTTTGCRLTDASRRDLGDAPDSTNHDGAGMIAYPRNGQSGVSASFPTVFDPATGMPSGPMHWNTHGAAWLGTSVTREGEADQLPDEDGEPNLDPTNQRSDRDGADDGLVSPIELPACGPTVITTALTVGPSVPVQTHYLNVWFDYNRDGDWEDFFNCRQSVSEWAMQNVSFAVGPGHYWVVVPGVVSYNQTPEDPLWMRVTLSGEAAPTAPGAASGSDGRGPSNGYIYGETEDHYLCYAGGFYLPCNRAYLPLVLYGH